MLTTKSLNITRTDIERMIATRWKMNPDSQNPFENRLLEEKDVEKVLDAIFGR